MNQDMTPLKAAGVDEKTEEILSVVKHLVTADDELSAIVEKVQGKEYDTYQEQMSLHVQGINLTEVISIYIAKLRELISEEG